MPFLHISPEVDGLKELPPVLFELTIPQIMPVMIGCTFCTLAYEGTITKQLPIFANIHLCGSVMTETFFVMAVSKMLYGEFPSLGKMVLFCLLLGVFAIGALTLFLTGYAQKHGIEEAKLGEVLR